MRPADDSDAPVVVWFRSDLRLRDNGALTAAAQSGRPVIAVFIFDDPPQAGPALGGAQRWWLHHSLAALADSLKGIGLPLVLRRGDPAAVLDALIAETGADTVYWNRRYAPHEVQLDQKIKRDLGERGLTVASHDGALMHEPTRIRTKDGGPYRVYSPFWRAFAQSGEPREPLPAPESIRAHHTTIASDRLEDWSLLPKEPDWSGGIAEVWDPGEHGAQTRLAEFVEDGLAGYKAERNKPAAEGTSRLSPHLRFGEITPFDVWHAAGKARGVAAGDLETFRKELAWREFSYHLLFHFPDLGTANFNSDFDAFPWRDDDRALRAWRAGRTGYPIVDAGMRQLWQTGWMHNRVRMIVGSFLIKDLMIDWRRGEAWFWDTLVDADPANNTASWQWVAGSGADAAPYFRVFNPVLQGEKFDADGAYVRRYVPELAALDTKYIHKPWQAPQDVLDRAGIRLGETYPEPMVDHGQARKRALAAYEQTRRHAA
ncbi:MULTISPECIES: deoxyribodipyrimidine photo-lyase [unclassified Roseitalea]|uniref:cryptochrome/photolyase family protein n=1 Tax=unclassified Roseitalea TaxID=2639107 RepID=UPI00273DD16C|nr:MULTISPECIES: deoxyribodipyrimidine photo-lyase [unclassified Roseitalea]